jgi:calcium-binding protein CML
MADTDGSGTIDAKELARVLSVYSPFSPRTVRLMLHIYADNSYNTTSIGPVGFVPLWRAIKQWQVAISLPASYFIASLLLVTL